MFFQTPHCGCIFALRITESISQNPGSKCPITLDEFWSQFEIFQLGPITNIDQGGGRLSKGLFPSITNLLEQAWDSSTPMCSSQTSKSDRQWHTIARAVSTELHSPLSSVKHVYLFQKFRESCELTWLSQVHLESVLSFISSQMNLCTEILLLVSSTFFSFLLCVCMVYFFFSKMNLKSEFMENSNLEKCCLVSFES